MQDANLNFEKLNSTFMVAFEVSPFVPKPWLTILYLRFQIPGPSWNKYLESDLLSLDKVNVTFTLSRKGIAVVDRSFIIHLTFNKFADKHIVQGGDHGGRRVLQQQPQLRGLPAAQDQPNCLLRFRKWLIYKLGQDE